jgi:hypothetical protein
MGQAVLAEGKQPAAVAEEVFDPLSATAYISYRIMPGTRSSCHASRAFLPVAVRYLSIKPQSSNVWRKVRTSKLIFESSLNPSSINGIERTRVAE